MIDNYLKDNQKERNSTMELLRIIAMFMIIFHHFSVHSWFYFNTDYLWIPEIWLNIIAIWWAIWNNLFVLISWYFLIRSIFSTKTFIRKLLKLLLQVSFYSFFIYIICVGFIAWFDNISVNWLVNNLNPLGHYRFFDTYILLFLIAPFLNKLLLSLNKYQYLKFLLLLFILNFIMLNVIHSNWSDLFWFITLYSLSAYISISWISKNIPHKSLFFYLILCFVLIFSITIANRLDILWYNWVTTIHVYDKAGILEFLISLLIFLIFTKIRLRQINTINILASTTFWVYLIHDNNITLSFIWNNIFNTTLFQESHIIIIYSILVAIFIFFTCSIIDLLRQYSFEKYIFQFFDKNIDLRIKKLNKLKVNS